MCGIVGLIGKGTLSPQGEPDFIRAACAAILHRGPDGQGHLHAEGIALGMRRLSILDLAGGWQPLWNEDESIALVCNGEVYNFIELRTELESLGHTFRTRSDCETIVHAYEQWGDEFLHRLRGMYAFCLYDGRRRRALLVRDRMGEKPVYLAESGDRLYFASELKALVAAGVVEVELDLTAVLEYFHYGFVPEPRCALRGVRKLPAGHCMAFDLDNDRREERRYWSMADAPPIEGHPAAIVRAELERVGELIIRSDVPVGVALSSGVDSSAIAALAQKNYPGLLQAFTVGYEGAPRQDERAMARQFAEHAKLPFHPIELRDADVVAGFPGMVFMRDDPIADIAGTGYLAVMKAASAAGVRVMLMGHGGDELFWGYPWVRAALRRTVAKQKLRASPSAAGLGDYLRFERPPRSIPQGMRWLKGLGGVLSGYRRYRQDLAEPADRLVLYQHSFEFAVAKARLPGILAPAMLERLRRFDPAARFDRPLPWAHPDVEITQQICDTYLVENGLAQGDRLSMAASVELRVPLCDYRFVETVIGLMKANPTVEPAPKAWLREAVRDLVPPFVFDRPKAGFNAPWRRWARQVKAAYGDQLADGELVAANVLRPGLTADEAGFEALTLELWCRRMRQAAPAEAVRKAAVAPALSAAEARR